MELWTVGKLFTCIHQAELLTVAEHAQTLQMDASETSQVPSGEPPLSISTGSIDLPEIDLSNVRSNLSKGGAACMLTPLWYKKDSSLWLLLGDRQHGVCGSQSSCEIGSMGGVEGVWLPKHADCDPPCLAAGGALSPNGVLSPRAQARQGEFQGSSHPAEDLRHELQSESDAASLVKSTPGMPAEAELPPMTPAEAQVQMTSCCYA